MKLLDLIRRRRPGLTLETLRKRFECFRRLLEQNNHVLKLITDAGEKLGGEYLFDTRYLEELDARLAEAVSAVVRSLGEISGNRYPALGRAFDRIQGAVHACVAQQDTAAAMPLIIGLDEVGTELADAAGNKIARLGEVRRLGIPVPDGFVVTVRAANLLLGGPHFEPLLAAIRKGDVAAAAGLAAALASAEPPPPVVRAIRQALSTWDRSARFAVRSSAVGEDGEVSFAGQYTTELNVPPEQLPAAWLTVVASLFSARVAEYRQRHGFPPEPEGMAVGVLHMVPAAASGVIYTVDPMEPDRNVLIVTAGPGLGLSVVNGRSAVDRFDVSRDRPYPVISRQIADKPEMWVAAPDRDVRAAAVPNEQRTAPAVGDEILSSLAEIALRIERHMKTPQDIEWALGPDNRLVVLQARPLRVDPEKRPPGGNLSRVRERYPKLMEGRGEVACRGVAAGPVFVIGADGSAEGFHPGDILVTRQASPRLTPLAAVAGALICDFGTVTGHLATVAREFRIPMLVNTLEATRILQPGTVATVDAEENIVYQGKVGELLLHELLGGQRYQETPEFRVLRRMLRHIAPLHLRDPGASTFSPDHCRTYHDILRFAHERALAELNRLEGIRLGAAGARLLDLEIPLDLSVIDLGGGTAAAARRGMLALEEVTSQPLKLLLQGLLTPGVWNTDPAEMDLEGFMASATRAGPLTVPGADSVQRNVAIVAGNYVNLNLRVGYHFNVVDASISDEPEYNYILFRFVGGVTDVTRRTRRARLLATILAHYDFRTDQEGDLILARLQTVPRPICEKHLKMIGRLIGFSRQLDILLRSDEVIDRLVANFLSGKYDASLNADPTKEQKMTSTIEVMVLDDEPTVCERLKDYLEQQGMAVETFVDSATAVQRLVEKCFHVVVTDLKMKGPTGIDVLVTVKRQELPTQVIIITGYRTIEATRGAEFAGAFGFVDKPFRMEGLGTMVKKAAKKARKMPWPA